MSGLLEQPLVALTVVLGLGIAAQWIAWRIRIPSILLFLTSGFALRYLGGLDPDRLIGSELLFPVISLGVATIMFEGGITLRLRDIETARSVVIRLISVGALITMTLATLAAWWLLGVDLRVATMIGAILVVSGPTVVMPLLRHVRPSRRIAAVIKWEGIVIDPVGAILAFLVFMLLFSDVAPAGTPWTTHALLITGLLIKTMLIAGVFAIPAVEIFVTAIRRYWIPDFLHSPIALAMALTAFTASNLLQPESGLVTITLMGILLANQRRVELHHVVQFKENLGVLVISCLFILLAARIDLELITDFGWPGLLFLAVLILIIRPLATWASTINSELTLRERIFLASLAPRGIIAAAVSTVFALHVSSLGVAGGDQIVAATFLVIVGTVVIYGLAAAPIASLLNLSERNAQGLLIAGASDWTRELAKILKEERLLVHLIDTNYQNISIARQEGIPGTCASILSEYVLEELELSGIGKFLALTANDDLNRLATTALAQHVERSKVFQLVPWQAEAKSSRYEAAPSVAKGRMLFHEKANFGELSARYARGDKIRRTKLTESFRFEQMREKHGADFLVLFVKRGAELLVPTVDKPITPRPGDTVISIVPTAVPTVHVPPPTVTSAFEPVRPEV